MTKEIIRFIICYDEERYLEECIYYINKLQIPLGFGIEIVSVKGVCSLSEEHNAAIQKYKGKYKIFLDQRTFIIRDTFLYDMLLLFRENPQIGMFGVLGKEAQEKTDKGRVLVWKEDSLDEINCQSGTGMERAVSLNGMLIATQYDAEWEETWDGLSCNQMQERGYEIVIPHQDSMWCLYDCGDGRGISGGEEYRFMVRRAENYRDESSVEAVELLLKSSQLTYGEHSAYVEKNALGNGSFAGYFWEDALFIGRNWNKYLEANGKVSVEDRTENEMHVVLSFNHKYAVYAAVMIQSLYDNNPFCNIYVHVLQKDLTEWDKSELEKQAAKSQNTISFYMVDSSILPQDVEVTKEWSIEAYFRLFMLEILPHKIDRVLYFDVDVIVNQPIYDFYFMDMKEYDIVGCRDFSTVMKKNFQDKREELFSSMKDSGDFTYINSGVMLMNLSRLREKVCAKDYLEVMEKQKGKLVAPDQDIINLLHWKCIGLVDEYRYDFFNACLKGISVEEVKQYVSIIHYAGPKPWQVGDIDMHAHRIWWEYAVKTDMARELVYETICSSKRLILEQKKLVKQILREKTER